MSTIVCFETDGSTPHCFICGTTLLFPNVEIKYPGMDTVVNLGESAPVIPDGIATSSIHIVEMGHSTET